MKIGGKCGFLAAMKPVKKALLPAAGLGTRFLPVTKSIPKEMLPIVAKPILLHLAEEVANAGIEELLIVSPPNGKESLIEFFKPASTHLLKTLKETDRLELLEPIEQLSKRLEVSAVLQEVPKGLGHAVLCGHEAIGNEPFAVVLGDELSYAPKGTTPILQSLMNTYESTSKSTVAVMEVPQEDVSKYGIIASEDSDSSPIQVSDVIEKPRFEEAPSQLALPGRYIFTAEIWQHLQDAQPGRGGEIQLSDAMASLAKSQGLLALKNSCRRYDAGDKLGYIQANLEYGLRDPALGPRLIEYLNGLDIKSTVEGM